MSRQLKFRAWLKDFHEYEENGMFYDVYVLPNNELMISFDRDNLFDVIDLKEVILMQYTGLKDKNGVEIYEGDILKRTWLFNGGYGETHTGEVVYDKEYARYVISRPKKHLEPQVEDLRNSLSDNSSYEVIGNIYENKELLDE